MDDLKLDDFNLIQKTTNPKKQVGFQWTIRNIKKMPCTIRSSNFSLVPDQPKDWCICIETTSDDKIQFELSYATAKKDAVTVLCVSRILKEKGSFLVPDNRSCRVFRGGDRNNLLWIDVDLPEEDVVIFQSSMTVIGHGLSTGRDLYFGDRDTDDLRDYMRMDNTDDFPDLKICAGGTWYDAHRCVLKARSPKFYSIHKEEILRGEVTVFDVPPGVFDYLLKAVYWGRLNGAVLAMAHQELYPLAVKYDLKWLRWACTREMVYSLECRNVCEFYMLAEGCIGEELMRFCEGFIEDNIKILESFNEYRDFVATRPYFPKARKINDQQVFGRDDGFFIVP